MLLGNLEQMIIDMLHLPYYNKNCSILYSSVHSHNLFTNTEISIVICGYVKGEVYYHSYKNDKIDTELS